MTTDIVVQKIIEELKGKLPALQRARDERRAREQRARAAAQAARAQQQAAPATRPAAAPATPAAPSTEGKK